MVFSSAYFVFVFLPVVLLLLGLLKQRFHNTALLIASLYFYAWGSFSHTFILLTSISLNYIFGRLIDLNVNKRRSFYLGIAIAVNLGLLGYLKYANFFMDNFNGLRTVFGYSTLEYRKVLLPIGVSFFTFQALSYLIDVYRRVAPVQKNYFDLALYISLFPQLVAGPIVRYNDIVEQLKVRILSISKATEGIHRFIIGFAKKVLIANFFGEIADKIFLQSMDDVTGSVAWLGIIAYSLQIYFDFSGYSDMAIGLGRVFGFDFMENFNFPYIANSIRDFWRRWHISLSTWFRDYLYIPLGGSRGSRVFTLRNLMIVFLLTGLWHGANWTFIVWGVYHGLFLLLERAGMDKILERLPNIIRVIYTLLIVMVGWVFFRSETLEGAVDYIQKMAFLEETTSPRFHILNFMDNKTIFMLFVALFLSFRFGKKMTESLKLKIAAFRNDTMYLAIKSSVTLTLFLVSLMYLAGNTYNPFIYFRF